jgi:hypothetical protein
LALLQRGILLTPGFAPSSYRKVSPINGRSRATRACTILSLTALN